MVFAHTKMTAHKRNLLLASIGLLAAAAATAQRAAPINNPSAQRAAPINSTTALRLPENPTIFGAPLPQVVKATAIVNGEVITQTDIDQRIALLSISNGQAVPAEEMDRLRQQVLRNLIDESLQIQAAKHEEIIVKTADIDRTIVRVAGNMKLNPEQLTDYLATHGSSVRTIRRQIEGEIAWRRLQSAKIENGVSVGDDEVKAVIERMEASKGTEEFHVGEIYLPANSANREEVAGNAAKIVAALQGGASFSAYARQYSEASTAAVGGDLGWVRPEQLPDPIANAVRIMTPNSLSSPIQTPGGYSILALVDRRKVLTADPRAAVLNLKQVSIKFPAGTSAPLASATVERFSKASQETGGCGGADKLAADFKGEVVQSDQVQLKDLPAQLQEMMLPMQIGQATRPFGSIEEGVRVLVICGRDEASSTAPTFDQVYAQLNEERVNTRSRRYLRDLRRDAVIDYR